MYTPEEIRQIYDEYQRRRALNIPITKEFAQKLKDAAVGVKNYTNDLENSLNNLKSAGVGLFKSFKDGKQGASVYNDVLTSGANTLATFLKKLGPLGTVLGTVATGIAKYVTAANQQSDALFDSYTELTKFGAGLDTGVDGIFQVSQQLGYSTNELEKFSGLLEKNRQIFPMFGGTTSRGVKEFGGLVDSLRGFETEFRVLGMSSEDVNESMSNYLRLQTMTGRSQIQTQDQLSKGAYDYIQQQMLVSRLTGQNAEMQKSAEQMMTENSVFQVAQRELRQKQQAALARGDRPEAERLEKQFNEQIKLIKMLPESMRKGAMDIMLGYVSASAEAEQFMRLAPAAARRIQSGQFEATEVLDITSREAGVNLDRFSGTLGKLGMMTDLFGEYSGIRDLDLMTARDTVANREALAKQQIEDRKQTQDATSDYAAMLVEQRRTREAAQDAIHAGVNSATAAMRTLTSAASAAAAAASRVAGAAGAPGVPAPAAVPTTGPARAQRQAAAVSRTAPAAQTSARTGPAAPAAQTSARTGPAAPAGATPRTIPSGSVQQQVRAYLAAQGITDPVAVSNILAQIQAESNFRPRSENLNYSGAKLFELYGPNQNRNRVRFRTLEEADALAAQGPEAVGNVIYGGRMGNAADEGFKYRGRGLIQLTFRNNYQHYSNLIGEDLVSNPDRANELDTALKIAAAYFAEKKRQGIDLTNITAVGRAVGYAGGADETARRAQMAESFMMAMGPTSSYRFGGIAEGPDSGYMVELHGTEAVVPLPDGQSIPVAMPDYTESVRGQIGAIMQQTARLDDLITIMRTRNQISEKILRAYQS
jgi:predicted chitinase